MQSYKLEVTLTVTQKVLVFAYSEEHAKEQWASGELLEEKRRVQNVELIKEDINA